MATREDFEARLRKGLEAYDTGDVTACQIIDFVLKQLDLNHAAATAHIQTLMHKAEASRDAGREYYGHRAEGNLRKALAAEGQLDAYLQQLKREGYSTQGLKPKAVTQQTLL